MVGLQRRLQLAAPRRLDGAADLKGVGEELEEADRSDVSTACEDATIPARRKTASKRLALIMSGNRWRPASWVEGHHESSSLEDLEDYRTIDAAHGARAPSQDSSGSRRMHVGRLALTPPALACRRPPLRAESSPLRWRAGNFAQALLLCCCASVGLRAAPTCKSAGPLTLSLSADGFVDRIERRIAYTGHAHERRLLGAAIFALDQQMTMRTRSRLGPRRNVCSFTRSTIVVYWSSARHVFAIFMKLPTPAVITLPTQAHSLALVLTGDWAPLSRAPRAAGARVASPVATGLRGCGCNPWRWRWWWWR